MDEKYSIRLNELLEEKNMTQKELAQKSNVTEATISNYIKAKQLPKLGVVEKIADVLDVSVDYLLGRTNFRKPVTNNDIIKLRKALEDLEFVKPGEDLSDDQLANLINFLKFNAPIIKNVDKLKIFSKDNNDKK